MVKIERSCLRLPMRAKVTTAYLVGELLRNCADDKALAIAMEHFPDVIEEMFEMLLSDVEEFEVEEDDS